LVPQAAECEEELRTQHHGGNGAGHGIVRCQEVVILAVFEEGRPRTKLDKKDFRPEKLKDTNLSVARKEHTTRPTFNEHVIGDESGPKGRLLGVACVETRLLRALTFEMVGGQPPASKTGRAVCVVDRVEQGDHDGHAALGFSEALEALSERQKSQWRTTTRNNLVDVFGSGSCRVPGWWQARHATRPVMRAPSRALPRRRALCTNWKKPM